MRKIILDNLASGFPADENFAKMVAEQSDMIKQLCMSLFGDETVILSGLEVITRGSGSSATTTIEEGYVWLFSELVKVDREVLNGIVPLSNIWLGLGGEAINGTYHTGVVMPTYKTDKGYITASANVGMAGAILRRLSEARRADLWGKRFAVMGSGVPGVATNIVANIKDGVLTLSGTVNMPLHTIFDRWATLGSIGQINGNIARTLIPCQVEEVRTATWDGNPISSTIYRIATVEIMTDGTIRAFIPNYNNISPDNHPITLFINITLNV